MIRIGFVGAGHVGQIGHLRNYDRVDGCEVVALAERRDRLRERVAARSGIRETYATPDALLEEATVDALVAVHPFERHWELCPRLLEAGLPLFTEKALALRVETGERLVSLAAERDAVHVIGYHKRSDPAFVHARETIGEWRATGEVGDLRHVRITAPGGDWRSGAPEPITTDETVEERELEAPPEEFDAETGRIYRDFLNVYVHQLNLLRAVIGDYEVTHADGDGRLLVAESDDGVTGTVELEPYSTSRGWQESMLAGFEDGYVRVDFPAPLAARTAGTVEVMHDGGDRMETRRPAVPPVAAMRAQAENFVAAARGEREPVCDSREALADLRTAVEYVRARERRE